MIFCIGGNTDSKIAALFNFVFYSESIRIIGLAVKLNSVAEADPTLSIKVAKCSIGIFSVGIFPEGGNQPCNIRRATGTGVPWGALSKCMAVGDCLSGNSGHYLKRVDIEKALSVLLHSRKNGVIKCELHNIGIFTSEFTLKHSLGEHHKTNGCTGFCISFSVG